MQLALGIGKYPQPDDIKQFFRRLDERLTTVRSLSAVTVASDIPNVDRDQRASTAHD